MSDWLPIESAPQDGTVVVLYCPEGVAREDYQWRDLAYTLGYFQKGGKWVGDRWLSTESNTYVHDYGGMTGVSTETEMIVVKPTHWKPLDVPSLLPAQGG